MPTDKRKIVKNSLVLYLRMGITIFVTLYTSRIVLENLGVEDFGIYSVVGGMAVMFTFFSNALQTSTQRFITYSIGKNNYQETTEVFSMSINCHMIISLLVLILSESIGLWFVNRELEIPYEKLSDANWVFQFSLASCILSILNAPYTGCITAYEKMSVYAWISILSTFLKLGVAFLIMFGGTEKLTLYAILIFSISLVTFIISRAYCYIQFKICRYKWIWDWSLFKNMMSFTSWNILKTGSIMGVSQGNNVLVNIFGGVVASAAMGIANQVNGTIYSFVQNVQTAFNPQITKTIATNELQENQTLVVMCAKYSTYLLLMIGTPLILNMSFVLRLWLGNVPDWTSYLCVFSILSVLIDCWAGPLTTTVMALGKIRKFQIVTSIILILTVPIAYVSLKIGMLFSYILTFKIIGQLISLCYSILYLREENSINTKAFVSESIGKPMLIFGIIITIMLIFKSHIILSDWIMLILSTTVCISLLLPMVYLIGLNKFEKIQVNNLIRKVI